MVVLSREGTGAYVVVLGVDFVEGSMYNRLDRVKGVEHLLACLEVLLRSIEVVQPLLDVGDVREGVDVGVLCVGFVDFVGEGGEESEAFLVIYKQVS